VKTPDQGLHTLAGAYAMDAISAADRARFERHLAGCAECAQEIASLREATARLATATAVPPPPGLKERVLAAAAATRQQPPAEPQAQAAVLPWRTRRGRLLVAAGAAAAAVAIGAAVVFGVSNGSMRDQLGQDQASSQQITAVLTARDATMMTGAVAGGGTVTIVMSHSRHALVFTAADLHALPASRGYELWLIGPVGDRPVTMLTSATMTGPVIASGLRPGDHLALTAEPAGGTARPTTPMMLDVALLRLSITLSITVRRGLAAGCVPGARGSHAAAISRARTYAISEATTTPNRPWLLLSRAAAITAGSTAATAPKLQARALRFAAGWIDWPAGARTRAGPGRGAAGTGLAGLAGLSTRTAARSA